MNKNAQVETCIKDMTQDNCPEKMNDFKNECYNKFNNVTDIPL